MNIIPANAQDIGKRAEQQDAFGFTDNCDEGFVSHSGFMAVLCDGMGGMALGGEASNLAAQTMLNDYMAKIKNQPITEALDDALQAANQAVTGMASDAGMDGEVGTTLSAAVIHQDKLYWISVGDSRIYLVRNGRFIQLTEDHNYSMELDKMVQQGCISRAEAENDPERHALLSYLGMPEITHISASIQPMTLNPGDTIILCSDGLYGSLTEDEFNQVLNDSPNDPNALVQAVLDKDLPHQDNITVAMLTCETKISRTLRTLPLHSKKKQKKRFFRLFIAIGLIFLTVAVGAGTYYYKVYEPSQQAGAGAAVTKPQTDPEAGN